MKFSCDRCGKKYATADQPQPGRVYKVTCKACGHLVVVRGPGSAAAAEPHRAPHEATAELSVTTPTPSGSMPLSAGAAGVVPLPAAEPQEPAPPREGYIDLFDDGPSDDAPSRADGVLDALDGPDGTPGAGGVSAPDPFAEAARASLAGGAADAFTATPEPSGGEKLRAGPVVHVPEIPKLPKQKHGSALALIGGGVVVLLGILGITMWSMRGRESTPPARPSGPTSAAPSAVPASPPGPTSAAPVPAPAAAPAPSPAPSPAAAAVAPAAAPAPATRPRREERTPAAHPATPATVLLPHKKPPKHAAAAPAPAPAEPAAPAPAPAAPAGAVAPAAPPAATTAAAPEPEVDASPGSDLPTGLTPEQIQGTLANGRGAFASCIATTASDSGVELDGRRVVLRMLVQRNGTVNYPTIDDVGVSATPLGACLKGAARLLVFPKFRGDPVRVEVPIALSK